MSDMTDPDVLQPVTRTCQIIVAALIMGVVFFLVIVVLVVPARMAMVPQPGGGALVPAPAGRGLSLITYIAVSLGLADLVLSFVIPSLNVASARQQIAQGIPPRIKGGPSQPKQIDPKGDVAMLVPVFQTQLIIGAAMLEGGAFFAAIAYMLERNSMALGMALILLVVLAARFPTRDRIQAWLDHQLRLLQEQRRSAL